MAARRLDVSWRRGGGGGYFDESRRGGDRGVVRKNGYEEGEISGNEDGVQLPLEKKRRFSPIVWDTEEKEARISLKNMLVVDEDRVDGGSVDGIESEYPAPQSSSLPPKKDGSYGQEQDQVEEEELPNAQNIAMSRWASDDDSPRDTTLVDDEGMCGEINASVNDTEQTDGWIDEPTTITQRRINMVEGCRSVFKYERLNEINEGTYGKVYKARDKKTGEFVALKKVKMDVGRDRYLEECGVPLTSLREMNILMSFDHPSIVKVKEVVTGNLDSVFMVMEYMEHDLKGVTQAMKQPFSTSEVKCLMLQLLEGVKYLHDNWVLHRDLKTSNILLNNKGELKVCDFWMSRQYSSPLKPHTSLVVTLWYRAPELLLGAKQYSIAVDMWSVGCIMAEMLTKEPLFTGKGEIDHLNKIFKTLGTPNETIWPGLSKLPGAKANFVKQPHNQLRKKFPFTPFIGSPVLSDSGFDLLNKLLTYDLEKRITADDAVNHPWFHKVPLPKSKESMPTFPLQYAKKR
ncbi:PREDICTED: cyclin-dependent kinase G-2 [Populus euphratica]|uniref:cyclin-dependent kinase n=1 Tax=Populus euphratica TaxID=75702 RepID=A0AAJ6U6U0_POPEU|nr:PREDICTED: cyclin-dependent kinase G-2 [Populus euphratica]